MSIRIRYIASSIRDIILSSSILVRLVLPSVNLYRRFLCRFGPNIHSVQIEGLRVRFQTETFEEIRHFHPVLTERDELENLVSELDEDDVFYDVGGHVGIYTCFIGCLLGGKNVKSFEPHPANVQRLKSNMELNGISADVFSCALSDTNGVIEMGVDNHNPGAIGHMSSGSRKRTVEVDTIRGDDLIERENIRLPTVLKIDVEGAELKVLRGLSDSLDNCRLIYCEVSDALNEYGDTREELYTFLQENGYVIETINSGEGLDHSDIIAREQTHE